MASSALPHPQIQLFYHRRQRGGSEQLSVNPYWLFPDTFLHMSRKVYQKDLTDNCPHGWPACRSLYYSPIGTILKTSAIIVRVVRHCILVCPESYSLWRHCLTFLQPSRVHLQGHAYSHQNYIPSCGTHHNPCIIPDDSSILYHRCNKAEYCRKFNKQMTSL